MTAVAEPELLLDVGTTGDDRCTFLTVRSDPNSQCGQPGYWEVHTTCPNCNLRARDVLCQEHGTNTFACNHVTYLCPGCGSATTYPPAVWHRL